MGSSGTHKAEESGRNQLLCGDRLLDLSEPKIMGVLNVTPDSFSDGGVLYSGSSLNLDKARSQADDLYQQGAAIIDVGGESTRPGADPVSIAEEMDRVLPVVEAIHADLPVVISVDTSSPELIRAAKQAGAGLINDVRALSRDGALQAASETELPVCLMHMQGNPQTMQANPEYSNVLDEVYQYLQQRMQDCCAAGIDRERILLDPGFGFGKSLQHNLALLKHLDYFLSLNAPLLVGLSRKSMLGLLLDKPVDDRLFGSIAAASLAVDKGASIIRCHDVAATNDAIKVVAAVREAEL